jgi:NADH dehydrogenase FAD-containing subunit
MLAGFVAGHHPLDDCAVALEPLVQRSGIRWIQHGATALDAQNQTLQLDDGSTLSYDWLSVNTGPVQDRDQLEHDLHGAREYGLFLRPTEAFSALWPRVVEMGQTRPLRITVIGTGAGGVELALAARHRLSNAAVTLVCGTTPPGPAYPPGVQRRLLCELKRRKVTVLQDVAVSLAADAVHLGCGANLACDVPLLANGAQAPKWLAGSGLALDPDGFLAVDMYLRSTSHSRVFAAGDASAHTDQALARSGAYAARAGEALAFNLAAAITGTALKPYRTPAVSLNLLSCGGKCAVATWGRFSAQGRWVWWLKNWLDRRFVARFSRAKM